MSDAPIMKTCNGCGRRYEADDFVPYIFDECPICKAMPEKGTFVTKVDADGKTLWNTYDCKHCKEAGAFHDVQHVPHGSTTRRSNWGAGLSTTRLECSNCKRWSGPWVSSDIVGGGW